MLAVRSPLASAAAVVAIALLLAPAARPAELEPRPGAQPLDAVEVWLSPGIDLNRLLVEDAIDRAVPGTPFRVGVPFDVALAPDRAGTWETLPSGDRLWRLALHSRDARWIVVGLGKYNLQPGAALRVTTPDRSTVLGPFTHEDVRKHGQLWFPPVDGDTVVLELDWPARLAGQTPNFLLTRVSHGYRPLDGAADDPRDPLGQSDVADDGTGRALGDSGSCNIDVVCPQTDGWEDQEAGVVHILRNGTSVCSGSLIATTARDCRPLILSAAHCFVASDAPSLTFRFNYQRPNCGSGTPANILTVTGSTFVSRNTSSDFYLVEMDAPPPVDVDPFFSGWDRSGATPTESTGIHHPAGDAKKWTHNVDPLIDGSNWGTNHWRITQWEQGTTEGGSSGSPLFDQNQRIVGQLHGGLASCSNITWDEYGKVSASWTGGGTATTRLSDALDPIGSGEQAIDGLPYAACLTPQPRLSVVGSTVDDATYGNGDGVIDPGERLVVNVEAGNLGGTLAATGVAGTLSSANPDVTVLVANRTFPDLAEDATAFANGSYEIEVAEGFACGDPFELALDLVANEDPGAWSGTMPYATGTEQVAVSYEDDMESGVNGWVTAEPTGANPWSQTAAEASSPATSWFVTDIATVSDSVLVSPAFAVPANAVLRFRHLVRSESTYDGGVLEVSTDGSTWSDAGNAIVSGGYTGPISTSYSSPIGGRQAWSGTIGTSAAFASVAVDLSAWEGQTVQLRWRFATDSSVSAEGWYVDDVTVDVTTFECSEALIRPGEVSAPGQTMLTIGRPGGDYGLAWAAPASGGPVDGYRLYAQPVTDYAQTPTCEGDLGAGTSATLATLADDSAFLVVAYNAAGEGSYGASSGGAERAPGDGVCP